MGLARLCGWASSVVLVLAVLFVGRGMYQLYSLFESPDFAPHRLLRNTFHPAWTPDTDTFNISVFLTSRRSHDSIDSLKSKGLLVWERTEVPYGWAQASDAAGDVKVVLHSPDITALPDRWNATDGSTVTIPSTKLMSRLQKAKDVFAVAVVSHNNNNDDKVDGRTSSSSSSSSSGSGFHLYPVAAKLVQPAEVQAVKPTRYLLTGKTDNPVLQTHTPGSVVPHWVSSLSFSLSVDSITYPADEQTFHMAYSRSDITTSQSDKQRRLYLPRLFSTNTMYKPDRDALHPLNATVGFLPLHIKFSLSSIGQMKLTGFLRHSFRTMESIGASEKDVAEVVRIFTENPAWALGLVVVVSWVHLAFDFLAIKSDVAFWRSVDSLRGLSAFSQLMNVCTSTVILLYLIDQDASMLLVIAPQAAWLVVGLWKLAKASGFRVATVWGVVPVVRRDPVLAHSDGDKTSQYDRQAFRVMGAVLGPVFVAACVWSLVYREHTGWYAWALSSLVGAVFTFGFVQMTPQLFVNYQLKSVAHMPWRAFFYRFVTTFIDDVFAFVIKMPILQRLSVLRDDVVFLVFLYQRWIYPVDTTRPAEGGVNTKPKED